MSGAGLLHLQLLPLLLLCMQSSDTSLHAWGRWLPIASCLCDRCLHLLRGGGFTYSTQTTNRHTHHSKLHADACCPKMSGLPWAKIPGQPFCCNWTTSHCFLADERLLAPARPQVLTTRALKGLLGTCRRTQQKLPPEALDELDPDDLHQPLMGHATADREEARSAGPPSSASPAADRRSPAKPHADPPLSSSSIELAQDPPHSDWPRPEHTPTPPKGPEEQPALGDQGDPPGGGRPPGGSPGSRAASGALPDRWGDFRRAPGSRGGSEQQAYQVHAPDGPAHVILAS